MWVFTPTFFVSVVADLFGDGLLVRARAREDIEGLRRVCPALSPTEYTPKADYHWRAMVGYDDWATACARMAYSVDYPNFKNEVAQRMSLERANVYHDVWEALLFGIQCRLPSRWRQRLWPEEPPTENWADLPELKPKKGRKRRK